MKAYSQIGNGLFVLGKMDQLIREEQGSSVILETSKALR
jgi:hypothetical protein